MYYKNMVIWQKQSKIETPQQFVKDSNLFIKQFYFTVWSAEKVQKEKIQKLWRQ